MENSDNIVRDGGGQPVVPFGTDKVIPTADTLPRPAPQPTMPATNPQIIEETVQRKATEGMTTYEELAATHGFKSPEDLAKSYKELRSQNSRVEATLSEAIKARQETPIESVPNIDTVDNTDDALRIVDSRIKKQVDAIRDAFEYKLHLIENPGDKEFASDAIKYVRENPTLKWDVAFKAAKADSLVQTEREKGKQEAYQSIDKKADIQSLHQSNRATEVSTKDIIEGIKTGRIPLSEARKFINSLQQ